MLRIFATSRSLLFKRTGVASVVFVVAAFVLGAADADFITLKNGQVVRGKITKRTKTSFVIQRENGISTTHDLSELESVKPGPTISEEIGVRAKAAATSDDFERLALFCEKHKRPKEAAQFWEKVISLEPNHRLARKQLGHIWHNSRWLSRSEYMKSLGLVEYKSRWMSETERDVLKAADEARKFRGKAKRWIELAVKYPHKKRGKKALTSLEALENHAVAAAFKAQLVLGTRSERGFVLDQIQVRPKDKRFQSMLVRTALVDPARKLRKQALNILESNRNPDLAPAFYPALRAVSPVVRINAVAALHRFPDRRSIRPMIATLRFESGGFGQAHITNLTQRAYIRDFELSSGGTGNQVAEVADPVIGSFSEGSVLDVKIVKVEWTQRAHVLQSLTGAEFGLEQHAWSKWAKSKGAGLNLGSDAQARRDSWLASKN